MECNICINEVSNNNIFTCLACKFSNCIDCHKKYLITNTQYPHCINPDCRSAIPYDIFLQKFNRKWIFGEYKIHRSNILLNREKSYLPEMLKEIAIQKEIEDKKKIYYKEIALLKKQIYDIEDKINSLSKDKTIKNKYLLTYACPMQDCKGFLNDEFTCGLCSSHICNKCYCIKNEIKKGDHECDQSMVDTFNEIKKDSKPCPTCGEFISKINGCDQMFCVKCGSAFSWKTGLVEKGIIHNPHAHQFFENNPEARNTYLNNQNNNNCRNPIPNIIVLSNNLSFYCDYDYIRSVHRYVSEFRQYRRDNYLRTLNNNNIDENIDIRRKYINNEYTDKLFKQILHKREKHNFFIRQLYQIVLFTYEIAEVLLWNLIDIVEKNKKKVIDNKVIIINSEGYEQIKKIMELLKETSVDTQNNITNLKNDFGYTARCVFNLNYYFNYY
jgi:hypothetical protein